MRSLPDQFTSFQDRVNKYPFRQCLLYLSYPLFYSLYDFVGIGILQHHDLSHHLLSFTIGSNGTKTVGTTEAYGGNIFYQNRYTVCIGDHNLFKVLKRANQSVTPDKVTLVLLFNIGPTGHTVIIFNGMEYPDKRDPHSPEPVRIDSNFILL